MFVGGVDDAGFRALANNSKCQDNMSLHAQKWSDIYGFWSDISFKILYFLVIRLSGVLGYNVRAVSEFYTRTAKMPGKGPVSDCYLELCGFCGQGGSPVCQQW